MPGETVTGETVTGPIEVLLQYLRQEERDGRTHVWLSGPARDVMRTWHLAMKGGRAKASVPRVVEESPALRDTAAARPAADQTAAWPSGQVEPELAAALAAVRDGVVQCAEYAKLRGRGLLRGTMVFAVGHPASPLVLVGEAPGEEEEKLGEPFVGPAGQLLTKMLTAMGLQRSQVYITNIVKYRPAISDGVQGSKNRRPTAEEIAVGLPHLKRELAALRPKVLVALGATALEGLAGEAIPIGRARGQWREFQGIPLMPTFHPSYLLHNEALTERRKVWEDLLQVMERLGLPISAKQRAYFKG